MDKREIDMSRAPRAISDEQRQLAEWMAQRERTTVPDGVYEDARAWWKWLHSLIRPVHRQIAREMEVDFRISVDYRDPISIIGALKYEREVRMTESRRTREDVLQDAKRSLSDGQDAWTVADHYDLSEAELASLVRRVEASGTDVRGYF